VSVLDYRRTPAWQRALRGDGSLEGICCRAHAAPPNVSVRSHLDTLCLPSASAGGLYDNGLGSRQRDTLCVPTPVGLCRPSPGGADAQRACVSAVGVGTQTLPATTAQELSCFRLRSLAVFADGLHGKSYRLVRRPAVCQGSRPARRGGGRRASHEAPLQPLPATPPCETWAPASLYHVCGCDAAPRSSPLALLLPPHAPLSLVAHQAPFEGATSRPAQPEARTDALPPRFLLVLDFAGGARAGRGARGAVL